MANWSNCEISIQCYDIFALKFINTKIQRNTQDEYFHSTITESEMVIDDYFIDNSVIYINGQGRWSGPESYFRKLALEYPNLIEQLVYTDSEGGSNYFTKFIIQNGEIVEEIDTEHFSPEAVREYGFDYFEYQYDIWCDDDTDIEEKQDIYDVFLEADINLNKDVI